MARARSDGIPFRWHPAVAAAAFTQEEASILEAWVRDGGALLAFADHAPHGETLRPLVEPFGVELANVQTSDPIHADPRWDNPWWILFTRHDGLIRPHPITEGVDSVVTLLGQSVFGPARSHPLLALSSTALDWEYSFDVDSLVSRSAAGRTQGVADGARVFKKQGLCICVQGKHDRQGNPAGLVTPQLTGSSVTPDRVLSRARLLFFRQKRLD